MPLPLVVRTPEDIAFKAAVERQYLIFNLLAGGRLAYDRGDMETAASRWEELLRMPGLPLELEAVVKPLAAEARQKGGDKASMELPCRRGTHDSGGRGRAQARVLRRRPGRLRESPPVRRRTRARLEGTVQGGPAGAGGAVVWLTRAQGPTPKPKPAPSQTVVQRGKRFLPHVLVVPVGTEVAFLNEDKMFHNVFSLSRPNASIWGSTRRAWRAAQVFYEPGPVRLLCNIHASMSAFVYVVDSPWYAQADAAGPVRAARRASGRVRAARLAREHPPSRAPSASPWARG